MRRIKHVMLWLLPLGFTIPACTAGAPESDSPEETQQTGATLVKFRQPWGQPCRFDCDCQLGFYCDNSLPKPTCQADEFGPPPAYTPCYGSCQCSPWGQTCVYNGSYSFGECQSPPASCSSDCDCGVAYTCDMNIYQCISDFGPYPECRCDKHCPPWKQHCQSGFCQ